MKKLFWLMVGFWLGSVGLKKLRENEKYSEMLDRTEVLTKDFRKAVSEGFRERESQNRSSREAR
jgi:DNA helicase TIP49 (TBP-interacting protein)